MAETKRTVVAEDGANISGFGPHTMTGDEIGLFDPEFRGVTTIQQFNAVVAQALARQGRTSAREQRQAKPPINPRS